MLFNSVEFLCFLPIVFLLYWFPLRSSLRGQNLLILVASYVFYGWWDWRFLSLIVISTLVDYGVGIRLASSLPLRSRKVLLAVSVAVNIGFLGVFKYYDFFVQSWIDAWASFGYNMSPTTLNIILPVGISFYTFQTMSYTIDIYRKQLEPTRDLIAFAAFVSFFPQLVAGPIERATNLLPQILRERQFSYDQGVQGLRLILLGLFKKVVVADQLAHYTDLIFAGHEIFAGPTLFLGALYFGFQIYCDFSGYSDIAIGTAKLFGVELMTNFKMPYFSKSIAEFWRRWHISLSTWFRDYVYIPLGGSRGSLLFTVKNVMIVFLVSGLWHGANWTFVAWGGMHGLLFLPTLAIRRSSLGPGIQRWNSMMPIYLKNGISILVTFVLVILAWVFFRAEDMQQAISYFQRMFTQNVISLPMHTTGLWFVLVMLLMDLLNVGHWRNPFVRVRARWSRILLYLLIALAVVLFTQREDVNFIYFQF